MSDPHEITNGPEFRTAAYGDSRAEVEEYALAKAREFFGHAPALVVDPDYSIFDNNLKYAYDDKPEHPYHSTKYHAGSYIIVRAVYV